MMQSLRVLLDQSVDYAGLFPPAALAIDEVAANYALYRHDPQAWMLGRLVLPVARLCAFEAAAQHLLPLGDDATPWRLSALASADLGADLARIVAFNDRHMTGSEHGAAQIDALELQAASTDAILRLRNVLPANLIIYVELPNHSDPGALIALLAELGLRGKVRTGGLTPEQIPAAEQVGRFIASCVAADLPFKATAGLHHPIRGAYPLGYAPDSARGMMYGHLNVFLATAFLQAGMALDEALAVLCESEPAAFQFDAAGVTWRGCRLDNAQLAQARRSLVSFGSCSFCEPAGELKALGLI